MFFLLVAWKIERLNNIQKTYRYICVFDLRNLVSSFFHIESVLGSNILRSYYYVILSIKNDENSNQTTQQELDSTTTMRTNLSK